MKTIRLSALAIALSLGMGFTTVSCKKDPKPPVVKPKPTTPSKEVAFGDQKLAGFIKKELKLAATAKITEADLLKLKELKAGDNKITDITVLTGLEKATELTLIDLSGNKVKDLTPIKDLAKVTSLNLSKTEVSILKPIENYKSLTSFNSSGTKTIKDITALAKNTNLEILVLEDNPIEDKGLETVKLFTKLHKLNLKTTGITKVDAIGELMSKGALLKTTKNFKAGVSELDLAGNKITDYAPVEKYKETSVKVNK